MFKATVSTISSFAIAAFFLLGTAGFASAQSMSGMHMSKGHKKTITGCLQKGDEAGEYSMKTADGKMYGLTSKKVQLSDHVGHKVTLHGMITPESAEGSEANENKSGNMEKGGDIDMTVMSLKMISTSCTPM